MRFVSSDVRDHIGDAGTYVPVEEPSTAINSRHCISQPKLRVLLGPA
jgi:hypothetical protein